jgi:hypothetical protein
MNNSILFQESDLEVGQTCFSENLSFLISCLNEFRVTHIDFLACNTLQYSNWKSYYALLSSQTSVVVGASNDATGNMQYGGDWIMESTSEDVMNIYFNANISNYVSLLASTISQSGGNILLRMNPANGLYVQYSQNGGSSWTDISGTSGANSWPVTFTNSTPAAGTILTIKLVTDISMSTTYTSGTSGYFIAGSQYVTFDGSGNYVRINGITNYPGFIQNGTTSGVAGQANIVVQNFITDIIGSSTLASDAGWLCQTNFARSTSSNTITNCTNNGPISGTGGGIAGSYAAYIGGSVTFTNCTNNGAISGNGGGISGFETAFNSGASAAFTNCTNNGNISGIDAGGISGKYTGDTNSSATFTNCTNTGAISGSNAGGIAGNASGYGTGGLATFISCTNTGIISGTGAGGIIGMKGAVFGGLVSVTNCVSTGDITGQYAGGIAGQNFANNTSTNCVISKSYSTGSISGDRAGGIAGASVGFSTNALYTASVDISNCYSLGTIATGCGGICGGYADAPYTNKATISISNSYSFGALTGTGAGLVAATLTSANINLTTPNTYVANNAWSDSSANANLTGDPLGVGISNKGPTWTSISANIPYLLSSFFSITNPTQIYTPNSASSSNNYSSVAGAYSPGIYSIQSSSQVGATITTNVAAIAGTSPKYYGYYNNIYTFTNTSATPASITASINASTGVLGFTLPEAPYPCFLEGSKILCFENNKEVYREIENLRKGDLVKTINNGYLPICMIGTSRIYNPANDYRVVNRLYKCSKEKYPTLFEDLYITGCHSILVPRMTDNQWENTKAVNGDVFVTDNHFRLIACADEKAEPFNNEGFVNIYHLALKHRDIYMNYGIYANGLLVESCSERNLRYLSNMRILGEEVSAVSKNVDNVFIMRQLVDTY